VEEEEFQALVASLTVRYGSESEARDMALVIRRSVERRKRRAGRALIIRAHRPRNWLSKSKRAKRQLWGMSEGCCATCGEFVPLKEMTVGHIIPASWGGTWDWGNIQCECEPCNRQKAARIIPRREAAGSPLPWQDPASRPAGPYPPVLRRPLLLSDVLAFPQLAPAAPRSRAALS
jgi:5-methylcytosine-specific restriction enzyme A